MRLIFAGTPEFAAQAVAALHDAGHTVALVLTQPDRPAGRGMKLQASAVKQWALDHQVPVAQPRSLRLDGKYPDDARAAQHAIAQAQAQVMVVAAYGLILPAWTLTSVPLGCLNIHASLLPRWRGAAPIHRAIEAGDLETGVCIMQMDEGLDTGAVLLRQAHPIAAQATTASLHDELAALGARCIVQTLERLPELTPQPQSSEGITYAAKIEKHEANVNWGDSAQAIARRLRAFDPFPGGHTWLGSESYKLWAAQAEPAASVASVEPGTILRVSDHGIDVACGQGVLRLTQLQRPGARRLAVAEFVRGTTLQPGQRFSSDVT